MNMPEVFFENIITILIIMCLIPAIINGLLNEVNVLIIMTQVDKYGTVGPHTIIRQHMDYGHWYVCLWHRLSDNDEILLVW